MPFALNSQFYNGSESRVRLRFICRELVKSDGSMQLSVIIVLYFPALDGFCSAIRQFRNVPSFSVLCWYYRYSEIWIIFV